MGVPQWDREGLQIHKGLVYQKNTCGKKSTVNRYNI